MGHYFKSLRSFGRSLGVIRGHYFKSLRSLKVIRGHYLRSLRVLGVIGEPNQPGSCQLKQ